MKKIVFPIAVSLMLWGCSKAPAESGQTPHNVYLTYPQPAGGESTMTLPATVEEARMISVGFKTAGPIERILVREGDRVSQGQLLAELDTTDYVLGVKQLREQYAMQLAEQQRRRQLHATRNMSDNDFEKGESGLRQLELQLKLQENKLAYCRLYAPAAGVIVKRSFEPGEMVDAGTPVFELMDNGRLEVVADLPVRDYEQRGSFLAFTGESPLQPDKPFGLQMLSLTPRADNNQLYQLKLGVTAGSASELTPGQNVTVRIALAGNGSGNFELPLSAVWEHQGRQYVWSFNPTDSVVTPTEVAIVNTDVATGVVELSGPLSTEGPVVRAGVHHLTEGEKVTPLAENTNPGNQI